jgi:hypothetical protein
MARRVDDLDIPAIPLAGRDREVMVMPLSCSSTIQSITASPSWTSPILWDLPV